MSCRTRISKTHRSFMDHSTTIKQTTTIWSKLVPQPIYWI